ncbi:uncharacterized protein Bfra_002589 [Botrytis fragariae]|uniref:Uncharacterized protein n=1 Tax=Botrytis fragariae TaxID=1964551 RepID=A0A8H6AZ65_9HELO|nr:uncharacterized protein Bfra_002589 [Botrytis fragariae]KAF5876187.1 hypothetical protein Bfra_002589 [Botrytis fragariae]
MANGENQRAKMTFDRVDDTNKAVAAGELPDPVSDEGNLDDSLKDVTNLQINISGIVDSGMSSFESVFHNKLANLKMATETEAKEKVEAFELQGAALWPISRRRRVKKQTPLRQVMLA